MTGRGTSLESIAIVRSEEVFVRHSTFARPGLRSFFSVLGVAAWGLCAMGCRDSGGGSSRVAPTIYVDAASTATSPNGSSWSEAYPELSSALAAATSGQAIWVAAGTYYPTTGSDRTASFDLVSGVSVYGGFAGTETALTDRDPAAHVTILSGDIDTNGVLDGANSYHVVRGADSAVLDGFTITMGYAVLSGSPPSDFNTFDGVITVAPGHDSDEILRILTGVNYIAGGGMLNVGAAPTVRNCTFENNSASKGGAVYNMTQRNFPYSVIYAAPTFEDCVFDSNSASARGGAVNNDMTTNPTFVSCRFLNNACDDKGGAIYSDLQCDATLVNVLIARNTAERGAGLVSDGSSQPSLLYVTIADNTATDIGAALYQGTYGANSQVSGSASSSNDPKLIACLVLGNTSDASGSSISNWLDDALVVDGASVVETTDGSLLTTTCFNDPAASDYEPIAPYTTLGWSASRDTSSWTTQIAALNGRTYGTYPYSTTSSTTSSNTYYVDASASGTNTGASWANAFTDLQSALTVAQSGDAIDVAAGTYYPTSSTADREAAFVIREGVSVIGGFPAGGGARDVVTHLTTLSGDVDRNATLDTGNAYHVVVGARNAMLDGFTVEGGYADGEWFHQRGAGVLLLGDITKKNTMALASCTFQDNYAVEGAALACYNYGDPTITTCTFQNNSAERGGAILLRAWSDATVTGTTFDSNTSTDRGGAVFVDYGAWPSFTTCAFSNNTSSGYGGAVYVDDNASQRPQTRPSFSGCTFTGNGTSASYGGALFGYNSSCFVTLTSCTFGSNTSGVDGADLGFRYEVDATLTSCTYSSLYVDLTVTLTVN